jgi:hypothetical protein
MSIQTGAINPAGYTGRKASATARSRYVSEAQQPGTGKPAVTAPKAAPPQPASSKPASSAQVVTPNQIDFRA